MYHICKQSSSIYLPPAIAAVIDPLTHSCLPSTWSAWEAVHWVVTPLCLLQTIPTMGAIILDPSMEKCLLVRGWKATSGWGFPRGKVSKDESDAECAIREVSGLYATAMLIPA